MGMLTSMLPCWCLNCPWALVSLWEATRKYAAVRVLCDHHRLSHLFNLATKPLLHHLLQPLHPWVKSNSANDEQKTDRD